LFGSWPSTNAVSTGFTTTHCRWSFLMRQIQLIVTLYGTDQ
jgi:hypothetical protein